MVIRRDLNKGKRDLNLTQSNEILEVVPIEVELMGIKTIVYSIYCPRTMKYQTHSDGLWVFPRREDALNIIPKWR